MVRFCNVFLFVFVHKSYFEFTLTRCEQPLAAIYGANGNWYLLRVPIRRLVGATRRLLGVYSAPLSAFPPKMHGTCIFFVMC